MYYTRLTLFLRRDLHQKKKVTRLKLFFYIKKRLTPKKKVYATSAITKKSYATYAKIKKATYAHFHNRVTLLIVPPALKRWGSPIRQG